ncbi:MAG: type I restriction-modification system subunit M [Hyphomicrobiaceae bacterium]|nr:type I restriction-modification system subunit M [Hyphomicrobiaceae bacterium]
MKDQAPAIVQKLWNYCDILRHDGVSYGDYVQQLTNILFLKMADEQTKPPFKKKSHVPIKYNWESLLSKKGAELENHYRCCLEELGKASGLLGVIYRKSQNKIQDPAKLERLIKLINEEKWMGLGVDVKGEIYEGLLEKNADSSQKGAGQYFTPRALISAIVDVIEPRPGEKIGDPACGTGGFFLVSHDYIVQNYDLDRDQKKFLKNKTFTGADIVPEVTRLCAMNMYLHGIGTDESQVKNIDSLAKDPNTKFDIVMTNPPFGKNTTVRTYIEDGKIVKESASYERDGFWTTTSNKQLNFLQHVTTILNNNGRCGIVIPDNVLFEGGAGETIRKKILEQFDCHTLLRLPTGIFYAGGVKANVLFFDKKLGRVDGKPWTEKLWIYDMRTNQHFTRKEKKMIRSDLDDFVKCYNVKNRHKRKETDCFHVFSYEDLMKRDKTSLDIFWLKEDSLDNIDNLLPPDKIADEIKIKLNTVVELVDKLVDEFKQGKNV